MRIERLFGHGTTTGEGASAPEIGDWPRPRGQHRPPKLNPETGAEVIVRTAEKQQSPGGQETDAERDEDQTQVAPPANGARKEAQVSAVAWLPRVDLDREAWESAGRKLGAIGRGSQWWIGDWLRYGNARWGEKYAAASRLTGYDAGSLRNMAWVASQFDSSLRSDKLSWSHHAILAPLEDDEKRQWVERAAKERLSVSKLRSGVQLTSGPEPDLPATEEKPVTTPALAIMCPNCGHPIENSDVP